MKNLFAGILIAMTAVMTGCASVPMASQEMDTRAKTFVTKPGKANVYIYRNESFGAAIKMPVVVNGKLVGDTGANTYVLVEVDPGKHTVVSKTENDPSLTVTAEAGKNYFVWQEVKMGMMSARSALHLVDEKTGRAAVNECKLVEGPK